MLTLLRIKNLALVDDLTLELPPGYSVVTGETGAGKSILIGALKLVLGDRADRSLLRAGSDTCTVEAVFRIDGLKPTLERVLEEKGLEPCEDDHLVLKRVVTASSTNRQFVNGSPTTLTILSEVASGLVDIHGPHDHQSLLNPGLQLDILDSYAGLANVRALFRQKVDERSEALARRADLLMDDQDHARELDLLRFQANEIEQARLDPAEESRLEQEHQRASNAARLIELTQAAVEQLTENEVSILNQAGDVTRLLQELARLDTSTTDQLEQHKQSIENLQDIASSLSSYLDRIEVDPDRLQALEERLNLIQSLKRKYGSSVEEVLAFGERAQERLERLEQRDEALAQIDAEVTRLEAQLHKIGLDLSTKRGEVIPKLCKAVTRHLSQLGFTAGELRIELQNVRPGDERDAIPLRRTGFDAVEFQFAPNPGEPPKPLRAIASSGELARVMLALKTVLAAQDQVPTLIFDEADANVGGETASAVGEKMRGIADRRQVICITHLPQVAASAAHHFVVTKHRIAERTVSRITAVQDEERVQELSRMLGGRSDAALRHAEEILGLR